MSDTSTVGQELELLARVAGGDRGAFAALYDRYAGLLFTVLLKILRDRAEAEDVLQEAFLQIWESAGRFDPKLGKPFNWALTLTRHKAIDRLRLSKWHPQAEDDLVALNEETAVFADTAADSAEREERAALIRLALAELPEDQRQSIELAFFGGLTQAEIAARLKQPLGTVKARIRRGMLRLRAGLEKTLCI